MDVPVAAGLAAVALVAPFALRTAWRRRLQGSICATATELSVLAARHFLGQPCPTCHEFDMRLLDVSPNARSIHYQCRHCEKKMHAPAASPEAFAAAEHHERFQRLLERYNGRYARHPLEVEIGFETPEAPLPFEQTGREPITEAVRSEVWRRDRGRCVDCESRENLEFDHIIPVARGGATSVRNLQLLCKACNQRKGARI